MDTITISSYLVNHVKLTFGLAVALVTVAFNLCDALRTDSEMSFNGTLLLCPVPSFIVQ